MAFTTFRLPSPGSIVSGEPSWVNLRSNNSSQIKAEYTYVIVYFS